MKRFFLFDKFNTAYDWRLMLQEKSTPEPEPKTNYVSIDGRSGTLDMTEVLTGEVTYNDRTVSASFLCDEGTYQDRKAMYRQVVASLHGKKVKIVEPDGPDHYFFGRCVVKDLKQTRTYMTFTIEAVCDPWRYAVNETERNVSVDGFVSVVIANRGERTVCPTITVTGTVELIHNDGTECENVTLTTGEYKIPDIKLRQGNNIICVNGNGAVTFTYREGVL